MFMDQRHGWLEQTRYVLQSAAYPIQLAVSSPSQAWNWLQQVMETRDALRVENQRLQVRQRELEVRTMRYEALAQENSELRGLRDALPPVADRWLSAEIVNIQIDSLRQRVLINRGSLNGVFKAQAVLDDKGVIGQTVHVGPFSAEVILITDPEHAIPVQIERTGLRTIAVGGGDTASLALPYLPGNADIKSGDILETSGLGGVFPAGYPVAKVTEVHRDAIQPLAQVRAAPFASVDTDREVMLVWFREDHPAAPTPPAMANGDLRIGNKSLQPQQAPPKPKAPPPDAAAAGTTEPNASASARKSTPASGTVNPTAASPSKKGPTAAAPTSDGAPAVAPQKSKEPAAGDDTPAPATPNAPAPEPPSDATPPRNQ
jgi:rod shape-determining protein MreC